MFGLLFIRELRRTLFSTVLILTVLFGSLLAVEHAYPWIRRFFRWPDAAPLRLDSLFYMLLIYSGFGLGVATFPRKLKELHYIFWQSLPLARHWIWLAVVLGHLMAFVAAVPLIFLLVPRLLNESLPVLFLQWSLMVMLFSAGCCFALLMRRTVLAFCVGTLLSLYLILQTALSIFPHSVSESSSGDEGISNVFVPIGLLALVFFALSCHFFVAGDFAHRRRNLKNWVVFSLVFLAFFATTRSHTVAWLLSGGRWQQNLVEVAQDGKRLVLVEGLVGRPRFCRVRVLDCDTGQVLQEQTLKAVLFVRWSRTGDVVSVVSVHLPRFGLGGLRPGFPLFWNGISRLGPGPGDRTDRMFEEESLLQVEAGGAGRLFTIVAAADQGLLGYRIDAGTGLETEVLRTEPGFWYAHLLPLGEQLLLDLPGSRLMQPELGPRSWLLGDAPLHQLKSLPLEGPDFEPHGFLVADTVYREPAQAAEALLRLHPPQDPGVPLVPVLASTADTRLAASLDGQGFALQGGSLMARGDTWGQLAELVPLAGLQRPQLEGPLWLEGPSHLRDRFHADLLPVEGLAAYLLEQGSEVHAWLYDAGQRLRLEIGSLGVISPQQSAVRLRRVPGLEGVLVALSSMDGRSPARLFHYRPADRKLVDLPVAPVSVDELLFVSESGRQIYRDPTSGSLFVADPGQPARRLAP